MSTEQIFWLIPEERNVKLFCSVIAIYEKYLKIGGAKLHEKLEIAYKIV